MRGNDKKLAGRRERQTVRYRDRERQGELVDCRECVRSIAGRERVAGNGRGIRDRHGNREMMRYRGREKQGELVDSRE